MNLPKSLHIALVCLVALALVSAALAFEGAGPWLALAKLAVLAYLAIKVSRADVYALQWSSMLVLLFVAEGVVRAMTDRWPLSALGAAAALCAAGYFVAVLAYLAPIKRAARAARREVGP